MHLIEPCCVSRHLRMLRDKIGRNGEAQFHGYGDLSLTELLPAMLTRYSETKMIIAAPSIPDQAAGVISKMMRKQWASASGNGKLDVISHLTIIADLSSEESYAINVWLKDNPFGKRLKLVDSRQEETVILLPDFAITGPVNLCYGNNFTARATTKQPTVTALWEKFEGLESEPKEEEDAPKRSRTYSRRTRTKAAESEDYSIQTIV